MLMTKRKPATVGEILTDEFLQPLGLTQAALAEAMGVQRKHVNELCNDSGITRKRLYADCSSATAVAAKNAAASRRANAFCCSGMSAMSFKRGECDIPTSQKQHILALRLGVSHARSSNFDRPKSVIEKNAAIVGRPVQDMEDNDLRVFDAVEDQIIAMNAPADTMVLVAGDEGEPVRNINEFLALAAQLPNE